MYCEGNGPHRGTELRVVPYGDADGSGLLCAACVEAENRWREKRNTEVPVYARYPIVEWQSLDVAGSVRPEMEPPPEPEPEPEPPKKRPRQPERSWSRTQIKMDAVLRARAKQLDARAAKLDAAAALLKRGIVMPKKRKATRTPRPGNKSKMVELVRLWQKEGGDGKTFARKHGIGMAKLYYWRARLRDGRAERSETAAKARRVAQARRKAAVAAVAMAKAVTVLAPAASGQVDEANSAMRLAASTDGAVRLAFPGGAELVVQADASVEALTRAIAAMQRAGKGAQS